LTLKILFGLVHAINNDVRLVCKLHLAFPQLPIAK
jgi:hypothetical protein